MTKQEPKVHLIKDANLGGIEREFVEVDRKADVGDYVHVTYFNYDNVSEIREVAKMVVDYEGDFYLAEQIDGETYFDNDVDKYTTLDPTDIVQIDGERFRLVERKADVGEKVISKRGIIETAYYITAGSIKIGENCFLTHDYYYVLIPVADDKPSKIHTCDKCGTKLGDIACSNSKGGMYCSAKCADLEEDSPQTDVDLIANLARRVAELERQAQSPSPWATQEDVIDLTGKVEMILDDIVTLDERTTNVPRLERRVDHITKYDLGWERMGPGRISNIEIKVSAIKSELSELVRKLGELSDEIDGGACR